MYSGAKMRINKPLFKQWIPNFQDVLMDVESAATLALLNKLYHIWELSNKALY